MLELKNISKSYKTANFIQKALDKVNLKFNKQEFVSILGPSGSGKTTLLNIIGGLDRYDEGDLFIKGKSTKKFKDKDWDSYRNKSVGFIFQSYNLINHIDILSNVEMGMTLSGKKIKQRKEIALKLLDKVGLKEHAHKKPNQLSGGQMQRVAIARALANDPEIILADEPTGALDSKTSEQIMNLIKEISKDKLVIMVTHNNELAEKYSDRIIKMKDGVVLDDTRKEVESEESEIYKLKKTKMSFFTALYLSLNNIKTKKGRTILTAFASSIGIIGISLILSLSNGFSKQIDKFERDTSDAMPIVISSNKISAESIEEGLKQEKDDSNYSKEKSINITKTNEDLLYNNINDEFINYISNIDDNNISSIGLKYNTSLNLIQKDNDKYYTINSLMNDSTSPMVFNSFNLEVLPSKSFSNKSISELITNYYDLLDGNLPKEKDEILVEVDKSNNLNEIYAKVLGISKDNITFDDILNSNIKLVFNDQFYNDYGEYFIPNEINKQMYENENNLTLKVVGIIRVKEEKDNVVSSSNGIYYTDELLNYVMSINDESKIVKKAKEKDYNILTFEKYEDNSKGKRNKEMLLSTLGAKSNPSTINIYPKDFDTKDKIIKYIEDYNKDKEEKDKITYLDQASLITNISGGIMTGITTVLVAFSSISLIVSSIMIGIITYISVLERVKEIGILRSLGARKKDIRRVFNAETFIIGLSSGVLGIVISGFLLIPINHILKNLTNLDNVAVMNINYAVILVLISVLLTLIGGAIPSNIASKKDPVESLRVE